MHPVFLLAGASSWTLRRRSWGPTRQAPRGTARMWGAPVCQWHPSLVSLPTARPTEPLLRFTSISLQPCRCSAARVGVETGQATQAPSAQSPARQALCHGPPRGLALPAYLTPVPTSPQHSQGPATLVSLAQAPSCHPLILRSTPPPSLGPSSTPKPQESPQALEPSRCQMHSER